MTKIKAFETKLINTVKKFNMFIKGDRVLVGLSGGKDSVALLFSLNKLKDYFGIDVCAFHLNHGIRGREADCDESFSKGLCESLDIPFYSEKVDVPSLAMNQEGGLEAVARDVRYSYLNNTACNIGCNKIATAHSSSDNSETLIITLLRNANIKPIPPVRGNIVRPLIYHTTDEIVEYCSINGLSYVTDSTNLNDDYTRNSIRHRVLPEIYNISPSFDEKAMEFSAITRSNIALVELIGKEFLEKNAEPMLLANLQKLLGDIAYYNVLHFVITEHYGISLSYKQFDEVIYLLKYGNTGQKISIENKKFLKKGYAYLELVQEEKLIDDYEIVLKPGKNLIPDSNISLWLESLEEYNSRTEKISDKNLKVNKLTKNILIKYNIITSPLIARSRREGEKYVCRGIMRSIKKFMVDEKIPAELRSRIPVVCDGQGIVWVPGLGIADRIHEGNKEGELLSLSIDFENKDVER